MKYGLKNIPKFMANLQLKINEEIKKHTQIF